MFNKTMPQGAQAPFSINGQPVESGVLVGLSWDEVVECYLAQAHTFPVIVSADGQTIEYRKDYGFDFTSGIPRDDSQFDQGGYYVG